MGLLSFLLFLCIPEHLLKFGDFSKKCSHVKNESELGYFHLSRENYAFIHDGDWHDPDLENKALRISKLSEP